jgi:hypothetical protein
MIVGKKESVIEESAYVSLDGLERIAVFWLLNLIAVEIIVIKMVFVKWRNAFVILDFQGNIVKLKINLLVLLMEIILITQLNQVI